MFYEVWQSCNSGPSVQALTYSGWDQCFLMRHWIMWGCGSGFVDFVFSNYDFILIKSLAFRPRWLRRLSGSLSSSTVWTHKLSLSVDNTEPFAVCLDAAERCSTILEVECPMSAHSRDIGDAGLVACWLSAPPLVLYWPVLSENNEILDLIITKKQEYISVTPSCRTHCEESTTISFLFVEIRMVPKQIWLS